jgi:hypothetical protein
MKDDMSKIAHALVAAALLSIGTSAFAEGIDAALKSAEKWTEKAADDSAAATKKAAKDAGAWTDQAAKDTAAVTKKSAKDAGKWTEKAAEDTAAAAKKAVK